MATRLQFEQALVGVDGTSGRCGGQLASAGCPVGAPADGAPLASLSDAIARGLIAVGVMPPDPLNPADADIAPLPAADLMRAIDQAEVVLLDLAAGRLAARPTTDNHPDRQVQRDARPLIGERDRRFSEVNAAAPVTGSAPDDPCWRVPGNGMGWGNPYGGGW